MCSVEQKRRRLALVLKVGIWVSVLHWHHRPHATWEATSSRRSRYNCKMLMQVRGGAWLLVLPNSKCQTLKEPGLLSEGRIQNFITKEREDILKHCLTYSLCPPTPTMQPHPDPRTSS